MEKEQDERVSYSTVGKRNGAIVEEGTKGLRQGGSNQSRDISWGNTVKGFKWSYTAQDLQ